jgi:hypothetical protein
MGSKDSDGEYTGHPLFPIPMDRVVTVQRRFDLIQVNRLLPDKKTRETCPILFKGSDLRSWQQILDMFGGECFYQLQGVCSKTRRYTARSERWFFSSPPRKPFSKSVVLPPIMPSGPSRLQAPPVELPQTQTISPQVFEELLRLLYGLNAQR